MSDAAEHSHTHAGSRRRQRAQGVNHDAIQSALAELDPAVSRWIADFVFGTVWASTTLSWDQQMLVAITALASLGHYSQLRVYLHGALQGGLPEDVLRRVLSMLTVYGGFPVAIQSLNVLKKVVDSERRRKSAPVGGADGN